MVRAGTSVGASFPIQVSEARARTGAGPRPRHSEPAVSDDAVVTYLKANGLFETFAAAAGVKKDATASDVHVPATDDPKRKKVVVVVDPKAAPVIPGNIDKALAADAVEITKRVLAAGDVQFAKGAATLYVSRPLTPGSADRLHDWAVAQGIPNVVPAALLHASQVYSSTDAPTLQPLVTLLDVPQNPRYLEPLGDKGALVMMFRSPEMQARHKEALAAGATHDFPSFKTHVTLSYDAGGGQDWMMLDAPDFPLQLGPEKFEGNNPDWAVQNGLRKQVGDGAFEVPIDVVKVDIDKRQLFGWASVSSLGGVEVIDKQGDIVPIEELEKAAYEFSLYSREHGEMHETRGTGRMIESCVFTAEKAAAGIVAKDADGKQVFGWWVGFQVESQATWERARAGELPEFSIGGRATPYTEA